MLLMPTTAPGYVDVQRAALDVCSVLPSHNAHLLKTLVLHYPEIRPSTSALAAAMGKGTSIRTVERNLNQLAEHGYLASLYVQRGVQRGGTAWRFVVLPTLTPSGEDPELVGRGPAAWEPAPIRFGTTTRLTVTHDGRLVPAIIESLTVTHVGQSAD